MTDKKIKRGLIRIEKTDEDNPPGKTGQKDRKEEQQRGQAPIPKAFDTLFPEARNYPPGGFKPFDPERHRIEQLKKQLKDKKKEPIPSGSTESR